MMIHAQAALADYNRSFTIEEIEDDAPQVGDVRVVCKTQGSRFHQQIV